VRPGIVPARYAWRNPFTGGVWSEDEVFAGLVGFWPGAPQVIGIIQQQCKDAVQSSLAAISSVWDTYAAAYKDLQDLYKNVSATLATVPPASPCRAPLAKLLNDMQKQANALLSVMNNLKGWSQTVNRIDCTPGDLSQRPPSKEYKDTLAQINNQVKQYAAVKGYPAKKNGSLQGQFLNTVTTCSRPGRRGDQNDFQNVAQ
jgi:hypothetical protein